MLLRFVCLANSFKEGGRCLAGVELMDNNQPVWADGRLRWVRPICSTPHGEVHTRLVYHLRPLDIIELEVTGSPKERGYQSENVYFNEQSIAVKGKFDENGLDKLCQHPPLLFGYRGKAISKDYITNLNHSLLFIKTSHFEVTEKVYDDHKDLHKYRLLFSYNGINYDLPITDPEFIHQYELNPDCLEGYTEVYLALSLSVAWNDWYYKLVATVLPNTKTLRPQPVTAETFDDLPF